ncbi:DinB family protein [Octadecabacter sp. 1_MG-2023]|uniref:DinB family protein n=1 Tax=unclassified Octadecabacter TaxID=196158 RepID=UPI001C088B70|nr:MULTISPECIES: DinB family protein [unclassified Octadecabacter]MBU2993117.1 damage-inducible protein DinB [Octadecabacter sp. B2R22]MDO6733431.1 DinB family protein [Octadecabacter sp. 1_MG-2023]
MARYNRWQNNGLRDLVKQMDEDALRLDRGAFFGSIFGTLNHLLWIDKLWMNRFEPTIAAPDSDDVGVSHTANPTDWATERFRMDGAIVEWARGLRAIDLSGDVSWYSKVYGTDMSKKKDLCVMQLFNHQTHHRGQVHAMMTAAGMTPIGSDLPLMPEI